MPTTLEALEILVLFFVPGFVATQVYVAMTPPRTPRSQNTFSRWPSGPQ